MVTVKNPRPLKKDLTGKVFERLGVLKATKLRAGKHVVYACLCYCGNITFVTSTNLISGHTQSCGCLNYELSVKRLLKYKGGYKHGKYGTPEYFRFHCSKYRAAKLSRTPVWADLESINNIYELCPAGFEVDHEIPLQGKLVSGLHVPENLQYLDSNLNKVKNNKFVPQFIAKDNKLYDNS